MSDPGTGDASGRDGGDDRARPGRAVEDVGEVVAGSAGEGEGMAPRARRGVLVLVGVLVVYYAVPIGSLPSGAGVVLSVVGLLGGLTLLAWLIVRQAQRLMRSDPADGSVRLDSLILLVFVIVPVFAAGYLALERADADQFESLSTKTDALYFTLSTLATVGFGDVHATGQLARGLVTLQIAFDLVFVAALVSLVTSQIRERAASRRASAAAGRPQPPGGGDAGGAAQPP